MRRSERLFAIIQMLRGRRRPLTAQELAAELEVGTRTIYRDMAELTAQGVPVRGEAGTGYVIDAGYDLPPLKLTPDELEAALLGAAWVAQRGDATLARGARSLIDKLTESVPKHLRLEMRDAHLRPARARNGTSDGVDIAPIRAAIRERLKVEITYSDNAAKPTKRVIWPFTVAYMEDVRIIVAHCELREDIRHFRSDRIRTARVLDAEYPETHRALRKRWETQNPQRK